ncbi:phosphotransferase system, enzyme I, PtsI, partial [Candidatus Hakubella thermalkaliphila]
GLNNTFACCSGESVSMAISALITALPRSIRTNTPSG